MIAYSPWYESATIFEDILNTSHDVRLQWWESRGGLYCYHPTLVVPVRDLLWSLGRRVYMTYTDVDGSTGLVSPSSLVSELRSYGLDGLDIDLEHVCASDFWPWLTELCSLVSVSVCTYASDDHFPGPGTWDRLRGLGCSITCMVYDQPCTEDLSLVDCAYSPRLPPVVSYTPSVLWTLHDRI